MNSGVHPRPRLHKQGRQTGSGMRTRTSIMLLMALLLTSVAIASLTIKLLNNQRSILEDAIRESRAQAMGLLANRVEQTLLAAVRTPFFAVKNIPPAAVDGALITHIREQFPEVVRVLFLDAKMVVRHSFPATHAPRERDLDNWLAHRVGLEDLNTTMEDYAVHTFIEIIDKQPSLFAVERVNETDPAAGWVLIRFDLRVMTERLIAPLLTQFSQAQDGQVQLQDTESDWDDDALNWPVGKVLPGWMLAFKPAMQPEAQRVYHERSLVWSVAGGIILAMLIATFAVWRELRREHALVDLRNRFVANVSHELKTPLALIRMYAETLYLHRVHDEARVHEYHRVLLHEAERLSQMINAVLDFSSLTQGVSPYRLDETDLRTTVLEVLESYRWRVEDEGLQLDIALDEDLAAVAHDRSGVTQMLLNLLDNAVKYAAAGCVVRVELHNDKGGVELAVIDHGPGIPEEERVRVRRPFQRGGGADSASGSGLGLALVDEIAKLHHAEFILTTSREGNGVHALLIFPRRDAGTE